MCPGRWVAFPTSARGVSVSYSARRTFETRLWVDVRVTYHPVVGLCTNISGARYEATKNMPKRKTSQFWSFESDIQLGQWSISSTQEIEKLERSRQLTREWRNQHYMEKNSDPTPLRTREMNVILLKKYIL